MPYFRIVYFIILSLIAFSGPVWLAAILGLFYILYYRSLEILFIAFAIDAFYGYQYEAVLLPAPYTIVTLIILLLAVSSEGLLMVYNQNNHV